MIRRNFFIREDQDTFLRGFEGNDSEHVRHAIDLYKLKIQKENMNLATESLSKSRGSRNSQREGGHHV